MNKRGLFKLAIIFAVLIVAGVAWVLLKYNLLGEEKVMMANPASIYCINRGYELEIRDEGNRQVGYCISEQGEECEEWGFYRGECSFEKETKCMPAQCCHSTSCVPKQDAPDCRNVICTLECREGTMDCEAGYCDFINEKCEVVWK